MSRYAVILFVLGMVTNTQAQSIFEIEEQIMSFVDAARYWRFHSQDDDTLYNAEMVSILDPLSDIDQQLFDCISSAATRQPLILTHNFNKHQDKDISIITSEDKNLRIFVWNTQMGIGEPGTLDGIALYKSGNKIKTIQLTNVNDIGIDNDTERYYDGANYRNIFIVKKDDKTYYLVIYRREYYGTSSMAYDGLVVFAVVDDELKAIPAIKTNNGIVSRLEYKYDIANQRELYEIHLDKNNDKLYVPHVLENQMTGKWQVYIFDGSKFVYDKIE